MRYILNSAVITSFGTYKYSKITTDQAREWAKSGTFISAIGYEETAVVLSEILGCPVQVNRITIKMEKGDQALVFRLVLPPGAPRIDPKDKGQILKVLGEGHFELGLLERLE